MNILIFLEYCLKNGIIDPPFIICIFHHTFQKKDVGWFNSIHAQYIQSLEHFNLFKSIFNNLKPYFPWCYFYDNHHDPNTCIEFLEAKSLAKIAKCKKETFHWE